MPRSFDFIKEHWEKAAFLVTLAFETVVAFEQHLAEISLETRFLVAGIAGLVATVSVAEMLCFESKRAGAGFCTGATKRVAPSPWRLAASVVAILGISALSVFLLNETATFHNVRLLQRVNSSDRTVGSIEIQPAHRPTNLTISLATNQTRTIRILEKAPASWNNLDPVDWRMQNESPYGVTLFLHDFKSPQVFGCWYRLSAEGELKVEVTPDPGDVRVLPAKLLNRYRKNTWVFGGLLCIVALVFWCYRSSWFRRSS